MKRWTEFRGCDVIFDSHVGAGISGVMRYVRGPGKDENGQAKTGNREITLGGQGFGFDVTDQNIDVARRAMEYNGRPEMQGQKKCQCKNDALHMSLSWHRGYEPSREEQIEASREFLKALGMENAMATYHAHTDRSHAHVHVIASRINPETGMAYGDYQRMYKGMGRAIRWEREKNQVTKEREWCHRLADATRHEQIDSQKLFDELFKNEATVKKTKLDLSFAFGEKFGNELEAGREQFVKDMGLVRLKKFQADRTRAYTTPEIWQEEARTLAAARRIKESVHQAVSEEVLNKIAAQMTLDEEQRNGLWKSTRDNGLSLNSGEAGTGKSHLQIAIRKAFEESNKKVKGLAFTNKVTQAMQANGFDAATIDSELNRLRAGKYRWDRDTVIMPDEAAQISTEHLKELFKYADRDGAKVIMSGDGRQLGSIKMGGLWKQMEKRFGTARLTQVKRNKDPDQKRAFNAMHERKFAEAVDIFKKKGSIRWNNTPEQSAKALADEYTKNWLEDPEATRLIMAASNDDADRLNEFARELRKQHGKLGPDVQLDTARGPKKFAVGDRLTMTETPNKKDKVKGLINGAFGRVEAIRELPNGQQELTFKLDRKKGEQERMFRFTVGMNKDANEVSGINHGYASTVYKAQGDTIDQTYVQHDPRTAAPTSYVELSRHADSVKIYASREDTNGYDDLAAQLKSGQDKTAAHDYMVHDEDRAKLYQPITPRVKEAQQHQPIQLKENNNMKNVDRPADVDLSPDSGMFGVAERFMPSKLINKTGEFLDRALGGKPEKEPEREESPLSGPKNRIDQRLIEAFGFMKEMAVDMFKTAEHEQDHDHNQGREM